ncbi:MAG: polyribonucleotide nucleotidyltransferase [Bacteroidota bacterium]|nr:polyribonucleotide nucleotidyltransferase [Candidatus Kapabacteria bacterium]MDW8219476.1 polyribonucleotide nucleotidyltransferase [Bacteroidota bacterium]
MAQHTVSMELNGAPFSLETGRFAKLADGAVMVRHGDTMVLVTAVCAEQDSALDFMPLTVEYREKSAASGKIPGGFLKREGRPTDHEILISRLIDRPIRPMFPEFWRRETQIIATVFSFDQRYESDVIAMVGASAAMMISSIPFNGPVSEVRVVRKHGEFICNPTFEQIEDSDLEIVVAGTDDSIVMVEGEAREISEELFVEALAFAHHHIRALNDLQRRLTALISKPKIDVQPPPRPQEIVDFVVQEASPIVRQQVRSQSSKEERSARRKELKELLIVRAQEQFTQEWLAERYPEFSSDHVALLVTQVLSDVEYSEMREMILSENLRLDGRTSTQIRPISIEVGILPRTHGSALFTRGETQSLGTVTLGTKSDEQMIDGLLPTYDKKFILHYNFPPFSTNEVKPIRGVSRREIGHGNLAERAFYAVLPPEEEFGYTIRVVSDVLMSNGSSSMATVCSGSLALFDAGVPIRKAVSGIAMGLIKEGDRIAILSDILGDEDHLGDMDFKVCGTKDGITACQMDMKIQGLSLETVRQALEQAREGRLAILEKMNAVIAEPRPELSPYAPRFTVIEIPVSAIGTVIGPGGETIRQITKETNTDIEIEDDGTVRIAATSQEDADKAVAAIRQLTRKPEEGEVYSAKVVEIREGLGAIVEFLPKTKGLLHVSQLDHNRVEYIGDVLKVGDKVDVKLVEIQPDGKFRLSRKAILQAPEGHSDDIARRERPGGHHRSSGHRGSGRDTTYRGSHQQQHRGGGHHRR